MDNDYESSMPRNPLAKAIITSASAAVSKAGPKVRIVSESSNSSEMSQFFARVLYSNSLLFTCGNAGIVIVSFQTQKLFWVLSQSSVNEFQKTTCAK